MAINRSLWKKGFPPEKFPSFPCPSCIDGLVVPNKDKLYIELPGYAEKAYSTSEWDPERHFGRFSQLLVCCIEDCGEIVYAHGRTTMRSESFCTAIERYVPDWELQPCSFYPAPHIISLPANLSECVTRQMKQLFTLFWPDIGSAGNRLRTSLEGVLDHLDIPRKETSKLKDRIDILRKKEQALAQTFDALRMIGNHGSHTTELSREALLDALDLYEDILKEIYSPRKSHLDKLERKIVQLSGRY